EVGVVGAPVGQAVDQPGVAVEVEDNGFVDGEQAVEIPVAEAVGMFLLRRHAEQVHHIDEADLQVRNIFPQQGGGGQGLLGGDIAAARHHQVGFRALVVAGPVPDADALGAVDDGGVHVEKLQVVLLVADDHIDVVVAAQAVVGGGQQAVGVGGQIDAGDRRAIVHHQVEASRVLVGEAVVVLAPHGGGDQQVDGGDGRAPGQVLADGQPLGVLVEHGVDDMDEGFVGG